MEESIFLKLVKPAKREEKEVCPKLDPLLRFKGLILNLTENALKCLNRISQQEMSRNSPSPSIMEEYYLLHHYLDFIKRLCKTQK
jgi:hypothetical protein